MSKEGIASFEEPVERDARSFLADQAHVIGARDDDHAAVGHPPD
jgi:hypothetical protein